MTSELSDPDRKIKELDIEKREEEIRQLKSRNKLNWMTPATMLAIIPMLATLGLFVLSEIKKNNEAYEALDNKEKWESGEKARNIKRKMLEKEIYEKTLDIEDLKADFGVQFQTLIAQKEYFSDEAQRVAAEFRSLQHLQDALEATSIEDSRSTMILMQVIEQSYESDEAKHMVKKVLILQTLGRVAFASSEGARSAAIENWILLEKLLRSDTWFPGFLDGELKYGPNVPRQVELITSKDRNPKDRNSVEIRNSLLGISGVLREAIKGQEEFLKPLHSMKAIWLYQAQGAAEKLSKAARQELRFEDVRLYANQFWRMYCGELRLVEGKEVETAMSDFGEILKTWEKSDGGILPVEDRKDVREKLKRLQKVAELAREELNREKTKEDKREKAAEDDG